MKRALIMIAVLSTVWGQDGQPVNLSQGPPLVGYEKLLYYSGSNLQYLCVARSTVGSSTITVSAASNANPVSFTATAHNLGDYTNLGATIAPVVCISGYTGNWAPANGCWKATIASANAFTIAVNSTGFGAVTGTATFTTRAPRLNALVWSISQFFYDGSNNLITAAWAANPGGAGSTNLIGGGSGPAFACSSRSSYAYQ